ncbi:MAG: hypothetical protein IPM31_12210 [Anaerolineae bacterium]|nr:hypothetical protein [Anaerolineae bacterium]MBL8106803.1 hypothetical protein [Anaerolineales bacterium]MCC7190149.1 hypothetical protein [Anaerolineales bacterium]
MAQPTLTPHITPNARVDEIERGWRLSIPAGNANEYRNAQLDDYARLSRRRFPHRFPLRLSLLARTSSDSIPGTWGFGLWNDPFGLSLGFGGNPFRMPALPNAVWFFGASKENYLSFKDFRPERSEERKLRRTQSKDASTTGFATNAQPSAQRGVANGFMAQTFRSPTFHPLLILAGIAFPFSRKMTRRMLGSIIGEDGVAVSVDNTEWHRYSLTWGEKRVSLEVDNVQVFESAVSPNPPLGLVIWIDNQYASFTPDGKIGFGVLANPEPAWLEIRELEIGD